MTAGSIDYRGALEAVDRIVNRGGEADDVLRSVLGALHSRGAAYAAVRFVENERLVEAPSVGTRVEAIEAPVVYEGARIGTLEVAVEDAAFVERVATLISPYVLVGSDTGGEECAP